MPAIDIQVERWPLERLIQRVTTPRTHSDAQVALSAMKSLALPAHLSAARPKRLRFAVFTLAGRIVAHAGRVWLRVSAAAERLAGLIAARTRLALIAQALPAG